MNNYYFISLPCFAGLFWFVVFVCNWKRNFRSQNVLAIIMLMIAISTYMWNLYLTDISDFSIYYKLDIIETFTTLVACPLIYLYFKMLTDEGELNWKDLLWLLPALLVGSGTAIIYLLIGEEKSMSYVHEVLSGEETSIRDTLLYRIYYWISIRLYDYLLYIQIILVLVYAIRALVRYHRRLKEYYSSFEGKSIDSNYVVLACFVISVFLSLIASYIARFRIEYYMEIARVIEVCSGSALLYLGYQAALQGYDAQRLAVELVSAEDSLEEKYFQENTDESEKTLRKKIDTNLAERFYKLIDEEKVYLQHDLRLSDLASMLHANRTYISRLINEGECCSFSDFINLKRIRYAQELIRSNSNLTQEQVAHLSGFLHVSTFSRTFKQQVGITFRDWMKKEVSN